MRVRSSSESERQKSRRSRPRLCGPIAAGAILVVVSFTKDCRFAAVLSGCYLQRGIFQGKSVNIELVGLQRIAGLYSNCSFLRDSADVGLKLQRMQANEETEPRRL